MKNSSIAVLVLLPAVLLWVVPVAGQDAPAEAPEPIVRELAAIQRTLTDLVDLMAAMRHAQDADLVLRRIELHERRLAPLARQLENNKQEQIDTRTSITDATEWKERTEAELDDLEREGREEILPDLRQQIVIAEAEIERLARRLQGLQERQVDLEDRLADGQDEIDVLDDLLREMLD